MVYVRIDVDIGVWDVLLSSTTLFEFLFSLVSFPLGEVGSVRRHHFQPF